MKATLKYNLPEENKEHLRAVRSLDLALALWEYGQYLRGQLKWGDPPDDLEAAQVEFYRVLDMYDINLEKLIE